MEQAEGKLKQGMLEFKVRKIVHPSPFTHNASSKQGGKIQEDKGGNPISAAVHLGAIPRKIRIKRGIVLPKRGVKIKTKKSQGTIMGKKKDDARKLNASVPVWPSAPNADNFKLPNKYALLQEFLSCIVTSVRLLKLRKEMCTFTNIQSRVEQMTNRQFTQSHLAQIKHILDDGMVLEKVSTLDNYSACVRKDLILTLTPYALQSDTEGQTGMVSYLDLKKIFHKRLVQFANSHPKCEDIPEATLPEPFNKNPLLESLSVSLEKFERSTTATAVNSIPFLEHNRIFHLISGHRNAQVSPTVGSHLPRTFKRHFSQSQPRAQNCTCNLIPEPVYSTGVRVLPCSVMDQHGKANEQAIFKQFGQEEGQDKPEISEKILDLRGYNELQSNLSAEAQLSIDAPVSISPVVHTSGQNVYGTALRKTASQVQVLSSYRNTPYYTCLSKLTIVDCVYPLTRSLDSTVFATRASAFSFGSPGSAIYYSAINLADSSLVHESNDSYDIESVAAVLFSSPVISQEGRSDFDDPPNDDLQYPQSSALSTPLNLFSFPRKWKEISLESPLKSPVEMFGLQNTNLEANLVKKKFLISHFHTSKHCNSGTGVSAIAKPKMLEVPIWSQSLRLLSPRSTAAEELCRVEVESALEVRQHVQQQGEEEGANIEGFYKEGSDEMSCKIIKLAPARSVGLAWRSLSDLLLSWLDWLCNRR